MNRLEGEVARAQRYGRPLVFVVTDLDGFKELNDRHGHAAGDEALIAFANVLAGSLRQPDDAFRIGGDEFAFLLSEATEQDARSVVERVQALLGRQSTGEEDRWLGDINASFGFATCPHDASDPTTLFRLADEAQYAAKRSGSGLGFVARA